MSVKQAQSKSIQTKITELNQQVAWFEGDEFELEEALEKFTIAEKLAEEIEQDIMSLKNEITVLKQKFDKE